MWALCLSTEVEPKKHNCGLAIEFTVKTFIEFSLFSSLSVSSCCSLTHMVLLNCASRTLKQRNNPMAQIVGKHCADPKWPGETLGGVTHSTPCAPEDADSSGRHKWGVLEQHSRPETKDDSETRKTRPCWNGCDSSLPSHAHTCTHCMLRAKPPAHCVNVSCHWGGRGGRYVQIEMRSQIGKSAVQRFLLAVFMGSC